MLKQYKLIKSAMEVFLRCVILMCCCSMWLDRISILRHTNMDQIVNRVPHSGIKHGSDCHVLGVYSYITPVVWTVASGVG